MTFCLQTLKFTEDTSDGIFMESFKDKFIIPNAHYISEEYRVYYVPFTIENKKVIFENWP